MQIVPAKIPRCDKGSHNSVCVSCVSEKVEKTVFGSRKEWKHPA
jgi:hypothetical protein